MISSEPDRITSTKNQHVQHIRELLAKKTTREQSGHFIVEGVRLCEEAIQAGVLPQLVLYSNSCSQRGMELVNQARLSGSKILSVAPEVLNALSDTETSQGLLMVVPNQPRQMSLLNFVIVIDQLRDPGNLGTILRTAVAAGVQAVFCTPGSVDAWSPKVVRSAMGAHFHVPVIVKTWSEIESICKSQNPPLCTCLAESGDGVSLWKADLTKPIALVIGGEAEGASVEIKKSADLFLNIPMPGGFESLNAAVAASIILFEVIRQRNQ